MFILCLSIKKRYRYKKLKISTFTEYLYKDLYLKNFLRSNKCEKMTRVSTSLISVGLILDIICEMCVYRELCPASARSFHQIICLRDDRESAFSSCATGSRSYRNLYALSPRLSLSLPPSPPSLLLLLFSSYRNIYPSSSQHHNSSLVPGSTCQYHKMS